MVAEQSGFFLPKRNSDVIAFVGREDDAFACENYVVLCFTSATTVRRTAGGPEGGSGGLRRRRCNSPNQSDLTLYPTRRTPAR